MMFFLGLDLGQAKDYTATVFLERIEGEGGPLYELRHLERVRQVPYPDIVKRVKELAEKPALGGQYHLLVDYTGVGRPVVDMLRGAGLRLTPVTITGGNAASRDGDGYHVPKRDLASVVQVLLQTGRLKIASTLPHAQTLVDELANFKVKISAGGHDSYGAGDDWRENAHDDMVLALALAAWYGEHYVSPASLVDFL